MQVKYFLSAQYLMVQSVINPAQTGGRSPGTGPVPARTGRAAGMDEPHGGAAQRAEEGGRRPQSYRDRTGEASRKANAH